MKAAETLKGNHSGGNADSTQKIEHCGLCGEFPCEYFLTTYDPNEGAWRVFYRAGQLAYRKRIGTEAWIQQKIDGKIEDPVHKK